MNKTYLTHLKKIATNHPKFVDASFFSMDPRSWDEDELPNCSDDEELTSAIVKAAKNKRIIRLPISKRVAYLLHDRRIAVVVKSGPNTKEKSLNDRLKRLDEFDENASRAYKAYFDELTGVLNRHGLKDLLEKTYLSATLSDDETERSQLMSHSADLILYAFDIDRFKSINDSYGHDVGDAVLSSFAYRIDQLAKKISLKYSVEVILGRPGGEEFEMIVLAALSEREKREIGDEVLTELEKPFSLAPSLNSKLFDNLPQFVTASIGVSWTKIPSDANKLLDIYHNLRKEADSALYRAKADGRKCLRVYQDIPLKHGKVIGFQTESNIVQIDVGSKVGIQLGQIFSVYFPSVQEQEISVSAVKAIEIPPMVSSATIKVIEIQDETSIATVIARDGIGDIPKGSSLQLIYTGSGLIPDSRRSWGRGSVDPIAEIFDFLEKIRSEGELGLIAAIGGKNSPNSKNKSTKRLTEFYALLSALIPRANIFSSMRSETFIVLRKSDLNIYDDVISMFDSVRESLASIGIDFYAGFCNFDDLPENVDTSSESLCFYAKAALKTIQSSKENIAGFDAGIADEVIYRWRKQRKGEQAMVDYQRFQKCGFNSADLDNQIGLVIMEGEMHRYFSVAELVFKRAAKMSPKTPVYKANLGLFKTLRGDYSTAIEVFEQVEDYAYSEGGAYILGFAKCVLELQGKQTIKSPEATAALLVKAAEANTAPPSALYGKWWYEVKEALKSGHYG